MNTVWQWSCPTRVVAGPGGLEHVVDEQRHAGRRIGVVVDAGVLATPAVRWLRDQWTGWPVLTAEPVGAGIADVAALAGWLRDQTARTGLDTVVAVGGGSLLDLVKLGSVAAVDDGVLARVTAGRCGVVGLPPSVGRRGGRATMGDRRIPGAAPVPVHTPDLVPARSLVPMRVLVPTTTGTGSEVSAVACVRVRGGHRLVIGEALRPEVAVLDPAATDGLPASMLVEGVLEALLRVLGPTVGSLASRPVPDAAGLALAGELVRLGDRLCGPTPAPDPPAPDSAARGAAGGAERLLAAELSAYTQASWAMAGRDPFGGRAWYIANEVSTVLGARKMVATVPVAAAVWARAAAGDRRFGHSERLAVAWDAVCRAARPGLGDDPSAGLRRLADRWGVASCPPATPAQLSAIAGRVVRAFGGGLPPLASITHADVAALLRESLPAAAEHELAVAAS